MVEDRARHRRWPQLDPLSARRRHRHRNPEGPESRSRSARAGSSAKGTTVAILSYGTRLQECLKAADMLSVQGLSTTVARCPFRQARWTRDLVERLAKNHEVLITIEEGAKGGFGSFVLEHLANAARSTPACKIRMHDPAGHLPGPGLALRHVRNGRAAMLATSPPAPSKRSAGVTFLQSNAPPGPEARAPQIDLTSALSPLALAR